MEVEVSADGPAGRNDGSGERMAEQILAATVGKVEVGDDGRRITFRKETADLD